MRTVGHRESDAILGAMRQVALAGGHALSYADTASILAAGHYLLRRRDLTDPGTLPAVEPADLVVGGGARPGPAGLRPDEPLRGGVERPEGRVLPYVCGRCMGRIE